MVTFLIPFWSLGQFVNASLENTTGKLLSSVFTFEPTLKASRTVHRQTHQQHKSYWLQGRDQYKSVDTNNKTFIFFSRIFVFLSSEHIRQKLVFAK